MLIEQFPHSSLGIIRKGVRASHENGMPFFQNPTGENLGAPKRTDDVNALNTEAVRYAPVSDIPLNGDYFIRVGITTNLSPHTFFVVPYDTWKTEWDNIIGSDDTIIGTRLQEMPRKPEIAGSGENGHPNYVPLNSITWAYIVKKTAGEEEVYPLDWYDLGGVKTGKEIGRPRLIDQFPNLNEEKFRGIIQEVYRNIDQRNTLQRKLIQNLYNWHTLPRMNAQVIQHIVQTFGDLIPQDKVGEIYALQLFAERADDEIATYQGIGHDKLNNEGTGRGPQSHFLHHNHNVVLFDLHELEKVVDRVTDVLGSGADREQVLSSILEAINNQELSGDQVYSRGRVFFKDIQDTNVEKIAKLFDPYSIRMMQILDPMIRDGLNSCFEDIPHAFSVETFFHGPREDGLHQRLAMGYHIQIPQGNYADVMFALNNKFMKEVYEFRVSSKDAWEQWYATDDETALQTLEHRYGGVLKGISRYLKAIHPTDAQIRLWKDKYGDKFTGRSRPSMRDETIGSVTQKVRNYLFNQIFDLTPNDKNLPRIPGFGMTTYYDDNVLHVLLTIIESDKGIAELYAGANLVRDQG